MSATTKSIPQSQARTLLGVFNFKGDDVFKSVGVLSGGEKSRLILAKLLVNPPNFICLDEPTTHLDIDGVEALTSCFKKYEGTLCFISHDLFFMREIANHMIEVNEGQVKHYHGGLDYYLEKKGGIEVHESQKSQKAKIIAAVTNKEAKPLTAEEIKNAQLKEAHQKHQQALKRIEDIKKETKSLEKEKQDLETETYVKSRFMSDSFGRDPEVLKEYGARLKDIQKRLREIVVTIDKLQAEKTSINR